MNLVARMPALPWFLMVLCMGLSRAALSQEAGKAGHKAVGFNPALGPFKIGNAKPQFICKQSISAMRIMSDG